MTSASTTAARSPIADPASADRAKTLGKPRVQTPQEPGAGRKAFRRYRSSLRYASPFKGPEVLAFSLLASRADNTTGMIEGVSVDKILIGDIPAKHKELADMAGSKFKRKQGKSTFHRSLDVLCNKAVHPTLKDEFGNPLGIITRFTSKQRGDHTKNDLTRYRINDDVVEFWFCRTRPADWDPPKAKREAFTASTPDLSACSNDNGSLQFELFAASSVCAGHHPPSCPPTKPSNVDPLPPPSDDEPVTPEEPAEVEPAPPMPPPFDSAPPEQPKNGSVDVTLRSRLTPAEREALRAPLPPVEIPTTSGGSPPRPIDAAPSINPEDEVLLKVLRTSAAEGHEWCSGVLARVELRTGKRFTPSERNTLRNIARERGSGGGFGGAPVTSFSVARPVVGRQELGGAENFLWKKKRPLTPPTPTTPPSS